MTTDDIMGMDLIALRQVQEREEARAVQWLESNSNEVVEFMCKNILEAEDKEEKSKE